MNLLPASPMEAISKLKKMHSIPPKKRDNTGYSKSFNDLFFSFKSNKIIWITLVIVEHNEYGWI